MIGLRGQQDVVRAKGATSVFRVPHESIPGESGVVHVAEARNCQFCTGENRLGKREDRVPSAPRRIRACTLRGIVHAMKESHNLLSDTYRAQVLLVLLLDASVMSSGAKEGHLHHSPSKPDAEQLAQPSACRGAEAWFTHMGHALRSNGARPIPGARVLLHQGVRC